MALLLEKQDKLNDVMKDMKLPEFKHIDFKFWSKFVKVMRPIAKAMNEVQGEPRSFFGSVLPTFFEIECRLKKLEDEPLTFAGRSHSNCSLG